MTTTMGRRQVLREGTGKLQFVRLPKEIGGVSPSENSMRGIRPCCSASAALGHLNLHVTRFQKTVRVTLPQQSGSGD